MCFAKMALIITLLPNYLYLQEWKPTRILCTYHTRAISCGIPLEWLIHIWKSLCQRTKTHFCLMSEWPSYPNIIFSCYYRIRSPEYFRESSITFAHTVFSLYIFSALICFVSSDLLCTKFKRITEVLYLEL